MFVHNREERRAVTVEKKRGKIITFRKIEDYYDWVVIHSEAGMTEYNEMF